jgi:hypothetical protein
MAQLVPFAGVDKDTENTEDTEHTECTEKINYFIGCFVWSVFLLRGLPFAEQGD